MPNAVGVIEPHSQVTPSLERLFMSDASSEPKLAVRLERAFLIWNVALPPPLDDWVAVQP